MTPETLNAPKSRTPELQSRTYGFGRICPGMGCRDLLVLGFACWVQGVVDFT